MKCYNLALQIDPKYILALKSKGSIYGNLYLYQKYIEYYDLALNIAPNTKKH